MEKEELGWIKIYRKLREWEWYKDSKMVHLFIHLLISANRKPGKFEGMDISRGQLITGRKQLCFDTGISEQSIRTCLDKLKSTSEITIKSTNKFSVITLINYGLYQSTEKKSTSKSTSTLTNDQPTTNQQLTTNKKNKNNKNNKNNIYRAFAHLEITNEDFEKLSIDYGKNEVDDILDDIENYRNNKKYISLYHTAKKWLKKEYEKNGKEEEELPYLK